MSDSLQAAMRAVGIDYGDTEPIAIDGEVHRFKVAGSSKRNGWYVLHQGDVIHGAFGDWKRGIRETFVDGKFNTLSERERQRLQEKWEKDKADRLARETAMAERAKKTAGELMQGAKKVESHPYLTAKKIKAPAGIRLHKNGRLMIPLSADGTLVSLQFIDAKGQKQFLPKGRTKGASFSIAGDEDGPIVLCEGMATGASIHEATGFYVVCAMNCGNLDAVAKALRERFPHREIVIAGDDDRSSLHNCGRTAAESVASKYRGRVVFPSGCDGTDFNDLHVACGLDEVRRQLESRPNAQEWTVDRLLEPIDYGQSLLGNRFLERGGTMAVVAPSGVGKTVGSIQMAACWSIGRPAFHIQPSSALRVLVVQNEDTENDTKGPFQGVIQNCDIRPDDIEVMKRNLKVVRLVGERGAIAAASIRRLASDSKDDLIVLNPLMAYVPGKQGEETEVFVREHLQPIAADLNVGIVAIHHTPKIGRQNGVGTGANEYERQYNSAGKAEVVNAFRGIINIMPVSNGVFKFTADKRGRKIGWTWDQKPTIERYFKHASDPNNPDLVWWRDATPEEAEQAKNQESYRDILRVIPGPDQEPVSRSRIRADAKSKLSIGKNTADDWLKLVIADKLLERVTAKNESDRNEALFRRREVEV